MLRNKNLARNKGELEKKTIRLFLGDAGWIDEMFPSAGHNVIIRELVRNFRKKVESKVNQKELDNEFGELTIDGSGTGEPSDPVPT